MRTSLTSRRRFQRTLVFPAYCRLTENRAQRRGPLISFLDWSPLHPSSLAMEPLRPGRGGLGQLRQLGRNPVRECRDLFCDRAKSPVGSLSGVVIRMVVSAVAAHILCASSRSILTFVRAVPRPVESRCRRSAWFDAVTCLRIRRQRREAENHAEADRYCPEHVSFLLAGGPGIGSPLL